ncbi:alcohol dehydrogenase catalytic domain-containing protein [Nocardioides sp.]|uniref:alcohol dehydrogenase catalytic domain-containing protein n=1 Tax=Nocardioides sp. TaxID=35761 RepID=UPI003429AE39
MRTSAVVLRGVIQPFQATEVELHGSKVPRGPDQVGADGRHLGAFPTICGHASAGVGSGPGAVDPGSRVAISFMAACAYCRFYAQGRSHRCDQGAGTMIGQQMDGTCGGSNRLATLGSVRTTRATCIQQVAPSSRSQ